MANTIAMRAVWGDRLARTVYGFNINPRTNRVDEYERFNRIREELYAREDAEYRRRMRVIGWAFFALLVVAVLWV